MAKRWILAQPPAGIGAELIQVLERHAIHPATYGLFLNRGLRTVQDIEAFLEPDWTTGIHDPFLFRQMEQAVERIFCALETGERITVHGDYDADGVTGSAVLISTLRELEKKLLEKKLEARSLNLEPDGIPASSFQLPASKIDSYIPHRDKEGYGLHAETVLQLKTAGTSLIISVDCGIANVAEIAQARALGMETIVVDHHQFGETLPDAICIHPKLPGEKYPFKDLAAVGVVWKLACGLARRARERGLDLPEGFEKWLLDYVAIATVTDMVPLLGENRVLEVFGLRVLNKSRRPGMNMLLKVAGCTPGKVDAYSVAFAIGPRINAAGRMDHAALALQLMLAEDEETALELALKLENQNRDRQKAMARMIEEADVQFGAAPAASLLAFWSEDWSPALVGLVAGKYLDRTGKPTVAIGKHGGRWVGSGRSFAAYDITAAVRRAGDGALTHVGGHVQACGFSFSQELEIKVLIEKLQSDALANLKDQPMPTLTIDGELALADLDFKLAETLTKFEPFGEGNRRPIFMLRGLSVAACDLVGATHNHLRCSLRDAAGRSQRFIGFNFGVRAAEFGIGQLKDVAFEVGVNEWNGRREIQCKLMDVRESKIEDRE